MLYIGYKVEVVQVKELPRVDEEYVLVTGEKEGLKWFARRYNLIELTPLLEALC
jgi:hypothetical protein